MKGWLGCFLFILVASGISTKVLAFDLLEQPSKPLTPCEKAVREATIVKAAHAIARETRGGFDLKSDLGLTAFRIWFNAFVVLRERTLEDELNKLLPNTCQNTLKFSATDMGLGLSPASLAIDWLRLDALDGVPVTSQADWLPQLFDNRELEFFDDPTSARSIRTFQEAVNIVDRELSSKLGKRDFEHYCNDISCVGRLLTGESLDAAFSLVAWAIPEIEPSQDMRFLTYRSAFGYKAEKQWSTPSCFEDLSRFVIQQYSERTPGARGDDKQRRNSKDDSLQKRVINDLCDRAYISPDIYFKFCAADSPRQPTDQHRSFPMRNTVYVDGLPFGRCWNMLEPYGTECRNRVASSVAASCPVEKISALRQKLSTSCYGFRDSYYGIFEPCHKGRVDSELSIAKADRCMAHCKYYGSVEEERKRQRLYEEQEARAREEKAKRLRDENEKKRWEEQQVVNAKKSEIDKNLRAEIEKKMREKLANENYQITSAKRDPKDDPSGNHSLRGGVDFVHMAQKVEVPSVAVPAPFTNPEPVKVEAVLPSVRHNDAKKISESLGDLYMVIVEERTSDIGDTRQSVTPGAVHEDKALLASKLNQREGKDSGSDVEQQWGVGRRLSFYYGGELKRVTYDNKPNGTHIHISFDRKAYVDFFGEPQNRD